MAKEIVEQQKDIVKKGVSRTEFVLNELNKLQTERAIVLPSTYSAGNALKAAWFVIQNTKDKNNKLALEVCSDKSIMQSLMDMCVQGLNPEKKQCYFIVRGTELTLSRSYFGVEVALRTVNPSVTRVPVQLIFEDDEFEYEIKNDPTDMDSFGNIIVTKHKQKLSNRNKGKIVGVYGYILYTPDDGKTEKLLMSDLMTIDEVYASWRQSSMNVFDEQGNVKASAVHGKFAEEMVKKTFISRLCKRPFNTSNDATILSRQGEAFARTTESEYQGETLDGEYEEPEAGQKALGKSPVQRPVEQTNEQPTPRPEPTGNIADMFPPEEQPF